MHHGRSTIPDPKSAIALLAVVICATNFAAAAVVRIKSRASISGPYVYLRDVADVSGVDAKTRARLEGIEMGPTPPSGRAARFDYAAIRKRLQSAGVNLVNVTFTGHSVVEVNVAADRPTIQRASFQPVGFGAANNSIQRRAEALLANAVRQYLKRQAPETGRVDVRLELDAADARRVVGANRLEFDVRGGSKPWVDRGHTLQIRFYDPRRRLREIVVRCFISRSPYVLAARYRIPKGEIIQADDLEWRQVESADRAFRELGDVVGKEAGRPISKDHVLTKADVRRVPLVRVNDVVKVVSRRGGVTVARYMKARKEGALDELVPFAEIQGRDVVLAKVTGQGRAEVVVPESSRLRPLKDDRAPIQFRRAPRFNRGGNHRLTRRTGFQPVRDQPRSDPDAPSVRVTSHRNGNAQTDGLETHPTEPFPQGLNGSERRERRKTEGTDR
jgi:flagella basal body P-ring formation protein FlgA